MTPRCWRPPWPLVLCSIILKVTTAYQRGPTLSGITTFPIPCRHPHQLDEPPTTRRGSPYPHALHHKHPGCSQAPWRCSSIGTAEHHTKPDVELDESPTSMTGEY